MDTLPLWVAITLGAALAQNLRSILQKRLTGRLSVGGATFSRFLFAMPIAFAYVLLLHQMGQAWPSITGSFWLTAILGGVGQIIGTFLLVGLFKRRNFAVGNAFSKTETIQAAFIGLVILGEALSGQAMAAIAIGFIGILALTIPHGPVREIMGKMDGRAALMGLGSGAGFGIAAVCYRSSALALDGTGFTMQAGFTLMIVVGIQTLIMGTYLLVRESGEITRVITAWRSTAMVSLVGVLSSIGWFTAMAIQNAALVRAVGQVELIFSILTAWLFFKEKITAREVAGITLIALSVILIVLK